MDSQGVAVVCAYKVVRREVGNTSHRAMWGHLGRL